MSERISFEETKEYIIANSIPESEEERIFIKKYKEIFDSRNKNEYDLNVYRKLNELNKTDIAKGIYARFQRKKDEENLRRYKEETEAYTEALIKKAREDREKALAKRNEILQNQKKNDSNCESFETKHHVNNTSEEPKPTFKDKISNLLVSKRVETIVSLSLCVVLYLVLLTTAFSKEKLTYTCYTTRTGECYHSVSCHHIKYSAYETTVYHASKRYRKCPYCDPRVTQYRTHITVRNYFYPALISIPVSASVFLFWGYRKKE